LQPLACILENIDIFTIRLTVYHILRLARF
jgi:hypothetical protein